MKTINTKIALLLIALSFGAVKSFAQSPWLYKKKKGFYQVQTTFLASPYTSLVVGKPSESTLDLNREVYTTDFSAYFQYGLSDKFNIGGKIPIRYVSSGEETGELQNPTLLDEGSLFGLSNIELNLKYGLLDKKLKVATSIQTVLNTVSKDLDKGLTTGYNYNAIGIFGHLGGSIGKRGYAYTDLGVMLTSNDFSDFFQNHIEGGYRFGRAFWVKLTLDIRKSFENGDYNNENLIQTGLNPNDQEWVGFGFGLTYETKANIGFNFFTGGAIDAQYIGFSPPITLGVYKKM